MLRLVTVIGVLGGMGAAMAEPVRMTSEDIKRAMPGALLEIDTPLSLTIPVKVGTDGLMSAEAGALGLTLGATKDRGRWWTENDKLCMKWFRWFDAKPRCMVLHRDGNRVKWAEASGENGTATITEATPVVAAVKQKPAPAPVRRPEPQTAVADEKPVPQARAEAERAPDAPTIIINRQADTEIAQTDYENGEPVVPPRFATAALGRFLDSATKPEKPEPSRLGMGAEIDGGEPSAAASEAADPAPPWPEALPVQRAEEAPEPARKAASPKPARTASTNPSTHAARKATAPRKAPAAVAAEPMRASFRVYGVEDGDYLNVRSGPSEHHKPVGAISPAGRGVQITGECRELWCPIRYGRLTGWVNRYYLAEEGSMQRASVRR